MSAAAMTTTSLVNYYGTNRMLAEEVGVELAGCAWVGVACAGGMCEVGHLTARTILVNDLHRHVINLARVVADPMLRRVLQRELRRKLFHPDELIQAQARCRRREEPTSDGLFGASAMPAAPDVEWATDYFVCSWMGPGSKSGTKGEFDVGLSLRWNAGGGDSNVRFRSALRSLAAWERVFQRCTFTVLDVLEFIAEAKQRDRKRAEKGEGGGSYGFYMDPPFPGPGDLYRYTFSIQKHRQVASELASLQRTRVVCRFYDVPLVREMYPEGRWTYRRLTGRTQTNGEAPELLVINGPSYASNQIAGE